MKHNVYMLLLIDSAAWVIWIGYDLVDSVLRYRANRRQLAAQRRTDESRVNAVASAALREMLQTAARQGAAQARSNTSGKVSA